MLETVWESRWLPDYRKKHCKVIKYTLVLPVIRNRKRFWFLMTDKNAVTENETEFSEQTYRVCLYLENRILKQILNQIRNDEIQDIRG